MALVCHAKVLHGFVNRGSVYEQFQELQKDALSGRLWPYKNCNVTEANVRINNWSDLRCPYSFDHVQSTFA